MARFVSLTGWCFVTWVLLTWTLTAEFIAVGLVISVALAVSLAPMGEVVAPWRLLEPRRFLAAVVLLGDMARRIVIANVSLARRIWLPSRPLNSGMVIVLTRERSEGGLGVVGLLSSLVVDNQIVDVDRSNHELLYHAVDVPDGTAVQQYEAINGGIERRVARVEGRSR
jgi:multicomponent Na+:H+ antiporter subunit E